MKRTVLILLVLLLPAAFVTAQDELAAGESAVATLEDADGNSVGEVIATAREDGRVAISVIVTDLPPGFHGFHIHSAGACDPASDPPFDSAEGHLNLDGADHPEHAGDLPPVLVNSSGAGELMTVTDRLTLADLFDEDGSAFIVHENPDNFANIPERYGDPDDETLEAGDSGDRIACGVVGENTAAG